jgi:hypothetical protein
VAIALVAVPWPEAMVERGYSRGVFPYLQSAVTWVSNRTSWAVIDVGLIALAVWLVWRIVVAVRHRPRLGAGAAIWELTRRVLRVAAAIVVLFYVNWGLNYRRTSLEVQLADGAATTASATATSSALVAAVEHAAHEASRLRSGDDERRLTVLPYPVVAEQLESAFQRALARLDLPPLSRAGRPKISRVLTPFYTAAGVTGMVNPVALESIVHPDLLPFERPMVLAHEWAHLAGYADEADASAIGWAACISGTAELQYAAHMFFLLEAAGDVPPATWRRIRAGLDPGVIEDFAALAKRLTRQKPVVREAAFTVYDQYLKTNQVEDGVRSYGRAVRVLLTPRMRALVTP